MVGRMVQDGVSACIEFDPTISIGEQDAIRARLHDAGVACTQGDAATLVVAESEDAAADLVRRSRDRGSDRVFVVLMSGGRPGYSARILVAGAGDIASWSPQVAERIQHRLRRWKRVDDLVREAVVLDVFVGASRAFREFLRHLVEIAAFGQGSVLLLGESGTGKEAAARLVHALDQRPDKAEFVTVDCTTLMPELVGSELFGHERGAFTGATASREGAMALVDGGTLLLDEVGDLPASLQPQLLRALQERTYKPVGANYWRNSSFRLICATNRSLEEDVAAGRFRADLYHRIATHVVRVPPLRERITDVPRLARHFLDRLIPNSAPVTLEVELEAYLLGRSYPGNVRELRQLMEAVAVVYPRVGPVGLGDLPRDEQLRAADAVGTQSWNDALFELSIRRALLLGATAQEIENAARDATKRIAIEHTDGNLQLAARRLGLSERALQKWRASHMYEPGRTNGAD
jgi:transcriptional regulator with GAF, ATPase, and Fis domain